MINLKQILIREIATTGYVRLVTNLGPLNIQLHSDVIPKTCENFLKLCQRGYYDNTKFHRSIRNFMVERLACILFHLFGTRNNHVIIPSRSKVVTLLELVRVENRYGRKHSKMNSNQP